MSHIPTTLYFAFTFLLAQISLRFNAGIKEKWPSLEDILLAFFVAALFIKAIHSPLPSYTLSALVSLLLLVQWFNCITMKHFGLKINIHTAKIFLTGVGQFAGEISESIKLLKQDIRLLIFPMVFLPCFHLYTLHLTQHLLLSIVLAYTLACVSKSKIKKNTFLYWLILSGILFYVTRLSHTSFIIHPNTSSYILLSTLLLSALMIVLQYQGKNTFLLPSLVRLQWQDQRLNLAKIMATPTTFTKDETDFITLTTQEGEPSEHYGIAKQANIILITLESVHSHFTNAYQDNTAPFDFFNALRKQGLYSKAHFTPSPFTNTALQAIYYGTHTALAKKSYLDELHQSGYQSCFLTSQKTADFNLDLILKTIGFHQTVDNTTVSKKKHLTLTDPDFFSKVTPYLDELLSSNSPFFLHIMNNQTHGPYFSYKNKSHSRKERYQLAVSESDQQISQLIEYIKTQTNLSNTIIIYTADHGESFMTEGYNSHASAIIKEQITVPFCLHHPKLAEKSVPASTHFDIFPTVFDLLGINSAINSAGGNMFTKKRNSLLVYSETKTGNAPSSFGWINQDEKIHIDRYLKKYQLRALNDTVIKDFNQKEIAYYLKLLVQAMQKRGIVR